MKQIYMTMILFLNSLNLFAHPTDVVTNLNGFVGITINENELYFTNVPVGKISKIDITTETSTIIDLVSGNFAPSSLIFNGDDLYFSDFFLGKIFKINTLNTMQTPTEVIPTAKDVITVIYLPTGLSFSGNDLYFAEFNAKKISKFDTTTLKVVDYENVTSFKLDPNPSSDFIKLSGLSKSERFSIHNILGEVISKGVISNKDKIDIQNFNDGIYFLKFKMEIQ
jgi:hypothetical protein